MGQTLWCSKERERQLYDGCGGPRLGIAASRFDGLDNDALDSPHIDELEARPSGLSLVESHRVAVHRERRRVEHDEDLCEDLGARHVTHYLEDKRARLVRFNTVDGLDEMYGRALKVGLCPRTG